MMNANLWCFKYFLKMNDIVMTDSLQYRYFSFQKLDSRATSL